MKHRLLAFITMFFTVYWRVYYRLLAFITRKSTFPTRGVLLATTCSWDMQAPGPAPAQRPPITVRVNSRSHVRSQLYLRCVLHGLGISVHGLQQAFKLPNF